MTRRVRLAGLACLLAVGLAGCGKYGPPVRATATGSAGSAPPARSGGSAVHPDDCRDPAHDHAEAADDGTGGVPDGGTP